MTARRAATFLATLGALVMSSGVALVMTATSANAAHNEGHDPKIVVCKYVSTPGGVLQGGGNPVEPNLSSLKNAFDTDDWAAWLENPTFPKAWGDAQGQSGGSIAIGYAGEGLTIANCPGFEEPPALCPEGTDNAGEEIPEGQTEEEFCTDEVIPPTCPEGTDNAGQEIPEGQTAEVFCDDPEVIVDPPGGETPTVIVDPPADKTPTVTPTVVSAGLGEVSTDLRGEQGLALIFAGMVLMVAAGGLGLRGRASRI